MTEEVSFEIASAKTAKVIWDILLTQYEGVIFVKTQRRINLIRNYENFTTGLNEPLTDIHIRFLILINDLERVDIFKTKLEICRLLI